MAKIEQAMRDEGREMTRHDVCDLLHQARDSHNRYIRDLYQAGQIHICRWQIKPECPPIAVYKWGANQDAPRPAVKSRREIGAENVRRRQSKIGKQAWSAIRAARYSGASVLVVAGMTVWRKGQINTDAARAAFEN